MDHREDGPAVDFCGRTKSWYLNDTQYGINDDFTNKSWNKFINTLIFS